MSFKTLRNDELEDVAEFFLKEVVVANVEKGPSKKELLAALESGEPETDDAPVTWEDYQNIYLPAQSRPPVVKNEEATTLEEVEVNSQADVVVVDAPVLPKSTLVKMERDQGRYEFRGATFKRDHPFALMTEPDAVYLVQHEEGFRFALPVEAESYYS